MSILTGGIPQCEPSKWYKPSNVATQTSSVAFEKMLVGIPEPMPAVLTATLGWRSPR